MGFRSFGKKIAKSALVAKIASLAITFYIWLAKHSGRSQLIGRENFEALEDRDGGFILAFWHSRLLLAPTVRGETNRQAYMLISTHRDGEIIANAVRPFGIEFIRGSAANAKKKHKNKSGAPALTQMIAALKGGHIVGMTPDGPRGPRQIVQPGVIKLAMMANAPILPAAYATSGGRALSTWDRFWLPRPFSSIAYVAGAPIAPPVDNTPEAIEACRLQLQDALNEAMASAERSVGRAVDTTTTTLAGAPHEN